MAETPSSLVRWLVSLDGSTIARAHVTLSEIIERAQAAQASESPPPTAVEKAEGALDEIGRRLAIFAPHGLDTSRMGDYRMADEIRSAVDDAREALGLERKHDR